MHLSEVRFKAVSTDYQRLVFLRQSMMWMPQSSGQSVRCGLFSQAATDSGALTQSSSFPFVWLFNQSKITA